MKRVHETLDYKTRLHTRAYPVRADKRIELAQGSITDYQAEALVCPANGDLEMVAFPGGVQFAFLNDGGSEIFEEVRAVGEKNREQYGDVSTIENQIESSVPVLSAHITGAGKLRNAAHVIHSVDYDPEAKSLYCDREVIAKSVRNVLNLAREKGLSSVGFPALGTNLYDVPLEECVDATIDEFIAHFQEETPIQRLAIVVYGFDDYNLGKQVLDEKLLQSSSSSSI